MAQAIVVTYYGPGNVRGSRLTARCNSGSVTIPYPHEAHHDARYRIAAEALCAKLGWDAATLVEGTMPDGKSRVFCFADRERAALRGLLAKHDDRDGASDLWPREAEAARTAIAAWGRPYA
jgi:hypothetical protein